ncbi:hypothetical protein GCM10011529_09700 [Polymorphobacter glacialis]|uniref:Dienelactone hydrolase domain-containing protein n=1 Tax=Sandarakinorhabdus glacialis TaxID=1614636 RepID=A0A916ZN35_9SPHN|nr:dienelactone hydrolase family protein [Polymorphobacter glacialis]GGE05366.1 hypothetical protein GCM10011529_09700 [Polymorphobacter glacialis]
MSLADYALSNFTADPYTRPVYRRGTGPAVIVIHEVPGLHPLVVDFADRLVAAGMTVFMPSLFGTPGKPMSKGYAVQQIALNICVRREFHTWSGGKSSRSSIGCGRWRGMPMPSAAGRGSGRSACVSPAALRWR